ncbi:MAG: hypothetical protein ACJ73S_06890 [Mycobacteriales bacterium]
MRPMSDRTLSVPTLLAPLLLSLGLAVSSTLSAPRAWLSEVPPATAGDPGQPDEAILPAAQPAHLRYAVSLDCDDSGVEWHGTVRVTFDNPGPVPLDSVLVRMWSGRSASTAGPVHLDRVTGGTPSPYQPGSTLMPVALAGPVPPGGSASVGFDVTFAVPVPRDLPGAGARHLASQRRHLGGVLPTLESDNGTGDYVVEIDHPAAVPVYLPGPASTGPSPDEPGRQHTHATTSDVADFGWAVDLP